MDRIVKRDGRIVPLDREKIVFAVLRAFVAAGRRNQGEAERVADHVVTMLVERDSQGTYPTVEEVQDLVERSLIEGEHVETAKAYILYRYEHALKREGKKSLSYSQENIPYKKLWEALSWAVDHRCVTLSQICDMTEEGTFPRLIRESEDFYCSELDSAVGSILERIDDVGIIIVAGPSSSGKTTTTMKIEERLRRKGITLIAMNVDNYFMDLDLHPRDTTGDYDYETPQALDMELVNRDLHLLLAGEEVRIPSYNFRTGKRVQTGSTMKLRANDRIIIDSLHGLFPEMTAGIAEERKLKLYIETLSQTKDADGRFVRWADVRMLRRMVRDMQFRNYSPSLTAAHWHLVRRSELRYIISRLREAHVIVNSSLAYELPVLKNRLGGLCASLVAEFQNDPNRTDAFERVTRVATLFEQIPEWKDEKAIPRDSLLREFVGGSIYGY